MGVTNADAFKMLFEGLYATELWSWSEDQFLEWLNSDYAGIALPEYFDRPICQCCRKPLDHLMVDMFAYDGSDSFVKTALTYIKEAEQRAQILYERVRTELESLAGDNLLTLRLN